MNVCIKVASSPCSVCESVECVHTFSPCHEKYVSHFWSVTCSGPQFVKPKSILVQTLWPFLGFTNVQFKTVCVVPQRCSDAEAVSSKVSGSSWEELTSNLCSGLAQKYVHMVIPLHYNFSSGICVTAWYSVSNCTLMEEM